MRISVGVTDNAWAAFLRGREGVDEANFWTPSGQAFLSRVPVGQPFLFKTKGPRPRLVGGGFHAGFYLQRVSEAWELFGEGNGCASESDLEQAIQRYRMRTSARLEPDPTIGCLVLRNLFFRDEDGLPPPPRWASSIVRGKTYDPDDPDWGYVKQAYELMRSAARVDLVGWDQDLVLPDGALDQLHHDGPRYGASRLTADRLGQGSFRLAVLGAYGDRCAVTGSRLAVALEAAHIKPYAQGGQHHVRNGLALRSDVHRLFDRGYVGVDVDLRLRVSPRVRRDSGNGVELYEREERGETISPPERADLRPDPEALAWHLRHVFRAA